MIPFLTFLSGPLGRLLAGVLVGVGLLLGGYLYGHHRASVACLEGKWKSAYEQQVEQSKALKEELTVLRARQDKVKTVVQTQIKEVDKYVPDNRACDVSPDVIKLLNSARDLPR